MSSAASHMLPSKSDCTRPSFHNAGVLLMRLRAVISWPPWREVVEVVEEEDEPVFSVQVKAMIAAAKAQQMTTRLKGARGTPASHSLHGTVCLLPSHAAATLLMLLWLRLLTHSGVSSSLCAAAATWPAATATTALMSAAWLKVESSSCSACLRLLCSATIHASNTE